MFLLDFQFPDFLMGFDAKLRYGTEIPDLVPRTMLNFLFQAKSHAKILE